MYRVEVKQDRGNLRLVFDFNNYCDASEFMETCLECGAEGTEIKIYEHKEG